MMSNKLKIFLFLFGIILVTGLAMAQKAISAKQTQDLTIDLTAAEINALESVGIVNISYTHDFCDSIMCQWDFKSTSLEDKVYITYLLRPGENITQKLPQLQQRAIEDYLKETAKQIIGEEQVIVHPAEKEYEGKVTIE